MGTLAQKQLLKLSRQLPEERIREVVDFMRFLLTRTPGRTNQRVGKNGKSLRRYVGGVEQGGLTSGIDDELHGRPVR